MTSSPPDPRTPCGDACLDANGDLLRSLRQTLIRARRATEEYLAQIEAESEANPDTTHLKPQITKLAGVIRDFQTVEKAYVQSETSTAPRDDGALDLHAAREEIERRLALLADTIGMDPPVG